METTVVAYLLSCVQLFATPQTVAHPAPLSMEFSRQEYCRGLPFPSPRHLPDPGIKPRSSAWQVDSLPHGWKGGLIQVFITKQMKPKIFRFLEKKIKSKQQLQLSPGFLHQLRHVNCLFACFLLVFILLN